MTESLSGTTINITKMTAGTDLVSVSADFFREKLDIQKHL